MPENTGKYNFMIITEKNVKKMVSERWLRDILNNQKHPTKRMDESGFTYLDYVLYRIKQDRSLKKISDDINQVLSGSDIVYYD